MTDVTIADGTTEIESYAFEDCENFKNVNLPNSIINIDNNAFNNCNNLTNITFSAGSNPIPSG